MVTECWTLSAWTVPGQELGRRDEHRASETSIGVRKLFAAGNWRYPFGQRLVEVTWTGCRVRPDAATIQGGWPAYGPGRPRLALVFLPECPQRLQGQA